MEGELTKDAYRNARRSFPESEETQRTDSLAGKDAFMKSGRSLTPGANLTKGPVKRPARSPLGPTNFGSVSCTGEMVMKDA